MEDILQEIVSVVVEGFEFVFEKVFLFLFDFLFVRMKDVIVSSGYKLISLLETYFSGTPSVSFLPYFFGLIFIVFIVKLVFNVLR